MNKIEIEEALFRNVNQILPSKEELLKKMSTSRIKIYLGIDPTGPVLHIGHLASLKKLRALQKLGHEVIILIGGMTATIGDPDKLDVRKQLTLDEVKKNTEEIVKQISKVLDFEGENPAKLVNNYDWQSQMTFSEIIKFASHITHDQMIERDRFQERLKNNLPIYFHEFTYPLMHGLDSVILDVDMEIGGNDQLFNMMMGRHLQKRIQNKEKFVLSVPILADSKGTKIGKTLGNVIPFGNDDPYSTYAGIMSLGDDCVINCMVAITDLGLEEISIFETEMNKNGANPMKYKKLLAYTVVQENYSEEIAKECQDEFEKTVQGKDFSEEQVMSIEFKENERILDFLKRGLTELSNSRIKEVIEQGGLEINGAKVTNMNQMVTKGIQIKFGKKTYLKAN